MISARTSAALQAAKARGRRLDNPRLAEARRHAARAKKERANRCSANVLPVIREIQNSGIKSLRGVARALAARGVPTARGGTWTAVQSLTFCDGLDEISPIQSPQSDRSLIVVVM